MADFAHILAALPVSPGTPPQSTPLAIYLRLIDLLASEVIDGDPVATAVAELMAARQAWQGTATELLAALPRPPDSRGWPKTGQYLSGRLKEIASALRTMGIIIDHTRAANPRRTRLIQLRTIPSAEHDDDIISPASGIP